jgi:hypothetical protein
MNIKDQLNEELKEAMRSGEKLRTQTIRSLKSAIKYAEIDVGKELDSEESLAVIIKQAKQRRDSIAEFEKAGRDDLVQNELAELAILEKYLPAQLSEADIEAKIKVIIAELGISDIKGLGQVMGQAMTQLKGQADGKLVSQITRKLLSN